MYEEIPQKILHMSIEEFKKWEVPSGWWLVCIVAEWKRLSPSAMSRRDWHFDVCVTIREGNECYYGI